jgi:diguanylate cyclase (GGDEF)-like protein
MGQRGSGIVGQRADGTEVPLGITILKTDAEGEPLMIAVVRDISEHVNRQLELKRLADTDPLTGLLNRRAFFEQVRAKIACEPTSSSSIVMLDLDHFKRVNDRFGHEAGDIVLQDFSNICRQFIRQNDIAARFGGEEFVLFLDGTSQREGFEIAESIRIRTSFYQFISASSIIRVTVSAGVAEVSGDFCNGAESSRYSTL